MSDSNPIPLRRLPLLDPVAVFAALGSKVRWPVIQTLADGRQMTTNEVAKMLRRDPDGVGQHLRVLDAAGIAKAYVGEDRRLVIYQIPAVFRPSPGVLDFGFCRIDLNQL